MSPAANRAGSSRSSSAKGTTSCDRVDRDWDGIEDPISDMWEYFEAARALYAESDDQEVRSVVHGACFI